MLATIQNDLILFKKITKAIIESPVDKTDAEKYACCASVIWHSDLPERLKDKCKEYVIDQMEERNRWME